MQLNNLKVPAEQVSFLQAVRQGLGQQQGLFFPSSWPKLDIEHLLSLPLVQRSAEILSALIGDELSPQQVHQ
ncbi:threonine synthase, partial [Alishewanella sp. SMS9]|nr:threonine synthase [Alishewanella sp. SMS9]